MELAVKVMKDSMAEPRDDDKLSPYVGAVLVRPDGTWAAACRGELRDGDHAEFTLLERKQRDQRLDGSVLYVTLEPCAPGSRGPGKLSCAQRVALARIKKVYVGVADPDPMVDRKGIDYLQKSGAQVIMFDRDLQDQISELNRPFFEQAAQRAEQSRTAPAEPTPLSGLESEFPAADLSSLDAGAVALYRERAGIPSDLDDAAFNHRLAEQGVLVFRSDGSLVPSAFGLMLFGTNPRAAFPQAGLLATIRYSEDRIETRDFDGPLVLIPEELEEWLEAKLPNVVSRGRMQRQSSTELPFEVIREAVVNALVHRDYEIQGAKCQMFIDPQRIVIRSPGQPVPPITLEQLQRFDAPMLSRNPRLHYAFAKMELAEERGLGLRSLRDLSARHGLPLPSYTIEQPYLNLVLYRNADAAIEVLPPEVLGALTPSAANGWKWFSSAGVANSTQYATAMGVGVRTARRHLAAFVELGLARTEGSGPATLYRRV